MNGHLSKNSLVQAKTQQVEQLEERIISHFIEEASKAWLDKDYLLQAYLRYLVRNQRESRWVSQIRNARP